MKVANQAAFGYGLFQPEFAMTDAERNTEILAR